MLTKYKDCNIHKGYIPNDEDFIKFSKLIFESLDYDPVYPVLGVYFKEKGFLIEEKLFGVLLYLTLYNTYWTLYFLEKYKRPYSLLELSQDEAVINKKVKIGADRRGIAWTGLSKVLVELHEFFKSTTMEQYFCQPLGSDLVSNFELLKNRSLAIPYNGQWAAFKHLDLLLNCAALPLRFSDWWVKGRAFGGKQLAVDMTIGMGKKLGKDLKETTEVLTVIDSFSHRWTNKFRLAIDESITYDISETFACKYHATYKGVYYPGHDIDKMQQEICGYDKKIDDLLYDLRSLCFKHKDLGEYNNWKGVRKTLKAKIPIDGEVKTMSRCSCMSIFEKLEYDTSGCKGCDFSCVEDCENTIAGLILQEVQGSEEATEEGISEEGISEESEGNLGFSWESCDCKKEFESLGFHTSDCEGCDGSCYDEWCYVQCSSHDSETKDEEVVCPYKKEFEANGYDVSGCEDCDCSEEQMGVCSQVALENPTSEELQEDTAPWECPYKAIFDKNGFDISNCMGCDCVEEQLEACKAVVEQL